MHIYAYLHHNFAITHAHLKNKSILLCHFAERRCLFQKDRISAKLHVELKTINGINSLSHHLAQAENNYPVTFLQT